MRYFLTTILLFNLVFFLGCKTTSEEKPTVSSSPSQPVEEPEEEVEEGKPQCIVVPISSLGEVSEVRKQILQNTLEDELKSHFRLIPQERFEEVQEKVFEELDYEECTEDQCIIMIQEMLQVENVFHLQVIGEGNDTQLSLSWRTLDEKRKETDYCEGCKTKELNEKVGGLVEKLIQLKEEVVVKEEPLKKVEPVVVETPKVVPKVVQEPLGDSEESQRVILFRRLEKGGWGWFKNGNERTDGKYVGEVINNVPNGQGNYYYYDGFKYVGNWMDGKQDGEGTFISPDGSSFEGEWNYGKKWNGNEYDKNGNITEKWVNGNKLRN